MIMSNILYKFISCFNFVDIVFLSSLVTLLILIVILCYFIIINRGVITENDIFSVLDNLVKEDNNKFVDIPIKDDMIEKTSLKEEKISTDEEECELLDLKGLEEKLKKQESERPDCTRYELDQEEKAIISYEELLQKHNNYAVNYEKEEVLDDVIVKKVNLNDLANKNEEVKLETDIRVISYSKEEEFLNSLRELNELLN